MESPNLFLSITPEPLLSLFVWIFLTLIAMYLARKPFHRCMASFSRIIYNAMRLTAQSVKLADKRLIERNREVLMTAALAMAERKVEREFDRIALAVQRDMDSYPRLQRKINSDLQKLEEDYGKCAEIPLTLPDWVKVIEAIANIKPTGDRMVVTMLEEIHNTLDEQHKAAVERHRRDVSARHAILSRMLPVWRGLHKIVGRVEKQIGDLNQHSKKIDRYMENYETIRANTDLAERRLSSSSLTRFFISGFVLAVAAVGAIINFNLVALPMSEMVGGASYIGGFKIANVVGMFIVCMEIVVGVFLMDALRITRLFSIIGGMEDKKRKWIVWSLFAILTAMAVVESALAFMRDQMAADIEALNQTLAGIEPGSAATSNIPTIGQMVMGFMLPYILAFVAIPFESFISSTRTVFGILCSWFLKTTVFLLRLFGSISFYAGRLIINIYDMVIFPCLLLEGFWVRKMARSKHKALIARITAETVRDDSEEEIKGASPCKESTDL